MNRSVMKRLAGPSSIVAALIVALLVSACGGSSNSSSNTRTVTVIKTVTQGASATNPTTSTGTTLTSTTTTPSGPPQCVAADLTPIYLGSNGAAGTSIYGFALRNTSGKSCHTYGWPGVAFLATSGAMLPTNVTRTSIDMVGTVHPTAITLKPGREASFRIAVSTAYNGGVGCKPSSLLQIYAPNDTVAMRVVMTGGSAEVCGKATVTPLQPGKGAFVR